MSDLFSEPGEFQSARLRRISEHDNANTSPEEALALAAERVKRQGGASGLVVIVEKPGGGVAIFSSRVTAAQFVFLLEVAKSMVVSPVPRA